MGRYSAGVTMAGINSANGAYALIKSAAAERLAIVEIVVNVAVAPTTAPVFYLARQTATALTPTTTLAGQPFDPADVASVTTVEAATWGTPPTITTASKIKAGGVPASIGAAFIWTFYDKPLMLPAVANQGLVVANVNASGATLGSFVVSATWDE